MLAWSSRSGWLGASSELEFSVSEEDGFDPPLSVDLFDESDDPLTMTSG